MNIIKKAIAGVVRAVASAKTFLAAVGVILMATLAQAQDVLSAGAGTNAVTSLGANFNNAANVFYPIMVGLLVIGLCIGVYRWASRRAGVRT